MGKPLDFQEGFVEQVGQRERARMLVGGAVHRKVTPDAGLSVDTGWVAGAPRRLTNKAVVAGGGPAAGTRGSVEEGARGGGAGGVCQASRKSMAGASVFLLPSGLYTRVVAKQSMHPPWVPAEEECDKQTGKKRRGGGGELEG